MASLIINLALRNSGVLVDADATPTLSDSTASYGIRRADTQEVAVAAGTPMTHVSTGLYQYIFSGAIDGVIYDYVRKSVVSGETIYSAGQDGSDFGAYLTVSQANDLASKMLNTPAWIAAGDDIKIAALVEATVLIDCAKRYQGRKYDPSQSLEFPRLAYALTSMGLHDYPSSLPATNSVWDFDVATQMAKVPDRIKRACLYEANSQLTGDRADRLSAIHDGVISQSVGSMSEQYRASGETPMLCQAADKLTDFYRLRSGQLL